MPKDIKVTIGVSVRPDNRGGAHTSDMNAVGACNQLFGPAVLFGKDELRITVETKAVPDSKDPGNGRQLQQERLDYVGTPKFKRELEGVDLLYIPGAPVAPRTQPTNAHGMRPSRGFKFYEAASRDAFESLVIEKAMTMGIPILAVCAGSWRLLESFGGEVRELSPKDYQTHGAKGWSGTHGLKADTTKHGVLPDAMIDVTAASEEKKKGARNAFGGGRPRDIDVKGANTTHWAVAAEETVKGKPQLKKHGAAAPNTHATASTTKASETLKAMPSALRTPADLLDVMVREPGSGTVEAFESTTGAPVIGTQWHPESFNPGMKGHGEKYANKYTIGFSQEIFRLMVMAAVASKLRRNDVVPALGKAFEEGGITLRHVADKHKNYRTGPLY